MAYVFVIVSLICSFLMFKVKIEYKISILLLSLMLFTYTVIPQTTLIMSRFILICFIVSELKNMPVFIKAIKGSILCKLTYLLIVSILVLILHSPHLRDFSTVSFLIRDELFLKYFVILYIYYAYNSKENLKLLLRLSYYGLIILTIFGIMDLVMHKSLYISSMTQISGFPQMMNTSDSERTRIQSLFINPFDYGYICTLLLIFHIYGYREKFEKRGKYFVALSCCIFGIFACGSRTVVICAIAGSMIYCFLAISLTKSIRISLLSLLFLLIAYQNIPVISDKINETFSIFDDNSTMEGSTVEGRDMQYAAVWYHIKDNPWLGCGYLYFVQDLGWGKGKGYLVDRDLYGLEGVIMSYLLERGIIGLIFYFVYYLSLLFFFMRYHSREREASSLGISVLVIYLIFANMTGELNSVIPTLFFLGYTVRILEAKKYNERTLLPNSKCLS